MSSPYRSGADEGALGKFRSAHTERAGCLLRVVFGLPAVWVLGMARYYGLPSSIAIMIALLIAVGAATLWWIEKRNPRGRILLHERGITSQKHGRLRVIRFDDVTSITSSRQLRGFAGREIQHHIVTGNDGTRIAFNLLFGGALVLLEAIEEATRLRLLADAQKLFAAGNVVRFGPIGLSKDGVFDLQNSVASWNELERVAIEMPEVTSGLVWAELEIWKRGADEPIAKYPMEQVPNVNVLLALVAHRVHAREP